jgi:predicted nucleic acid-binding protein
MAKYFLDSSAFTKRYKKEIGSDYVNTLFAEDHELFYLNLAIIEVRKVFYRQRFYPSPAEGDRQNTDEEFNKVLAQFATDLQRMNRIYLTEEMIAYTEMILREHWLNSSFDLAHLAAYLVTRKEHADIILVSSDTKLVEVARSFVGNEAVINPEELKHEILAH